MSNWCSVEFLATKKQVKYKFTCFIFFIFHYLVESKLLYNLFYPSVLRTSPLQAREIGLNEILYLKNRVSSSVYSMLLSLERELFSRTPSVSKVATAERVKKYITINLILPIHPHLPRIQLYRCFHQDSGFAFYSPSAHEIALQSFSCFPVRLQNR
jgi:hypothetical protein